MNRDKIQCIDIKRLPECSKGRDDEEELNTTVDPGNRLLSALILRNNNLSGKFPEFLQYSPNLKLLDLSQNKFDGELPTWITGKLPHLSFLLLRHNMFSGSIPLELTGQVNLQFLDLANNRISGAIPRGLANLKAMAQYSQIRSDNPLESKFGITGVDYNHIEAIKYDDSQQIVMKGQQLYYTSAIVYMVGLDLSCNNLLGGIPEEIACLSGLKLLNISHNQFTGKIPEKIGLLQALESLDLSFNELYGEIPWSLSAITTLSHLNLSYNNLSGRIPLGSQLQTLSDPESIYIGNNNLCGPPLSICSQPEVTEDHHEGNNPNNRDLYLGLAAGFVTGLWLVFVIFLFVKTWRVAYFQLSDNLYRARCKCLWPKYVQTAGASLKTED